MVALTQPVSTQTDFIQPNVVAQVSSAAVDQRQLEGKLIVGIWCHLVCDRV